MNNQFNEPWDGYPAELKEMLISLFHDDEAHSHDEVIGYLSESIQDVVGANREDVLTTCENQDKERRLNMMTDNMRKFVEAVEADADLRVKTEALQGADDVVEQTIAIAADCGYTLTAEDFDGLSEEGFQESGGKSFALDTDDLEGASGGMKIKPIESPKDVEPILQMLFKVKREQQ